MLAELVNDEIEDVARKILLDEVEGHPKLNKGSKNANIERVESFIEKARDGWTKAPKEWERRFFQMIVGLTRDRENSDRIANRIRSDIEKFIELDALEPNIEARYEDLRRKQAEVSFKRAFMGSPSTQRDKEEKKKYMFLKDAWERYVRDYEFNISSDLTLLRQLITTEWVMRKLGEEQEEDVKNAHKYSKPLKDAEDRYAKLADSLGILRKGREKDKDQKAKDFSSLSKDLDRKLDMIKQLRNKDQNEESMFIKMQKLRNDPTNKIPESEFDAVRKELEEAPVLDAGDYYIDVDEEDDSEI